MVPTTSSSPKTYRALEGKYPEARAEERESTRRGISMNDTARGQIVRDAWRLAKPYWTSEEKWSACASVGFLDKILYVLVMLDNPAHCISRSG